MWLYLYHSQQLALEIKYVFSFKQRGLTIADSLPCLTFTGMAVTSGVVRSGWVRRGGSNRDSVSKKRHPEAPPAPAICQTSHHISHKPQHKMNLMSMRRSGSIPSYFKTHQKLHTICTGFSVLHSQENGIWKSIPGYFITVFWQCMSVSMIWSNKMHFTCCIMIKMVSFPKSDHI